MCAASAGARKALRLLLYARAPVNTRDKFCRSAHFYAVESNDLDCILLLVIHGAELNAQDLTGSTSLIRAVSRNSSACVHTLQYKVQYLQIGADFSNAQRQLGHDSVGNRLGQHHGQRQHQRVVVFKKASNGRAAAPTPLGDYLCRHFGAFLNVPTVVRAKHMELVITTVHTLTLLNPATFSTLVLDLTCTESAQGNDVNQNTQKPPVLAAFLRHAIRRSSSLPREVVVLCEIPTYPIVHNIKRCLSPTFNAQVVPWTPALELGMRLASTDSELLSSLDIANTTDLHVRIAPTAASIDVDIWRLNRLVRLQLTNVRMHTLAAILRPEQAQQASLAMLRMPGAEIDNACYCSTLTNASGRCQCLLSTAQIYDSVFERGNGNGNGKLQSISLMNMRVNEEKVARLVAAKGLRSIHLHLSALHQEEDKCGQDMEARVQAIFDQSDLERFTVVFEDSGSEDEEEVEVDVDVDVEV